MMALTDIIGYTAAFCTTLAFLPQTIKVMRTKDTSSLSLIMYFAFCIGVCLWMGYGFLRKDIVIVLANAITFLFALPILSLKALQEFRAASA